MSELRQLTQLSVKLSNLVHEQQKERGATAIFVGSKGRKFKAELATQRANTDKFSQELNDFLNLLPSENRNEEFDISLKSLLGNLQGMEDLRIAVDGLNISKSDAISYYTNLNAENLDFIGQIGKLSEDPNITSRYISFTSFLQSKERAGIERAVGASGVANGKFTALGINQFKSLIAEQDTYMAVFLSQAMQNQILQHTEMSEANAAQMVLKMRKIIINGGLEGKLDGISSASWFDTITQKINELKVIENGLAESLINDITLLESRANTVLWTVAGVSITTMLLIVLLSIFIVASINRSFKTIISRMTELASGKLDVELPPAANNEIGQMIECVVVFKDNAVEKANLEIKQEEDKKLAEVTKQQLMDKMADDFDTDIGSIVAMVSDASKQLQDTAVSMTSISQSTSENADLASDASDLANSNVQSVAAASEEMSQSVEEINHQVSTASKASKSAVYEVNKTSIEMKNLATTVDKIGGVVTLIASIADQTNLLALNATIESARAGEAGRGFAIVASEVKGLASKTAEATDEISRHINEVHDATQQALVSMDGIGKVIVEIDDISTSIATSVEQQGRATQEISSNAQEAASGTQNVSLNIGEVTNAAQQAGKASNEVMQSASELLDQSNKLKDEIKKFTNQVRSTG
ncbi:MAG: nitrate- and nitrite sensing domain-containing protein [Hyphomicrobiales bacterium]